MYLTDQIYHFPVAKRRFAFRGILAFQPTNEAVICLSGNSNSLKTLSRLLLKILIQNLSFTLVVPDKKTIYCLSVSFCSPVSFILLYCNTLSTSLLASKPSCCCSAQPILFHRSIFLCSPPISCYVWPCCSEFCQSACPKSPFSRQAWNAILVPSKECFYLSWPVGLSFGMF